MESNSKATRADSWQNATISCCSQAVDDFGDYDLELASLMDAHPLADEKAESLVQDEQPICGAKKDERGVAESRPSLG